MRFDCDRVKRLRHAINKPPPPRAPPPLLQNASWEMAAAATATGCDAANLFTFVG